MNPIIGQQINVKDLISSISLKDNTIFDIPKIGNSKVVSNNIVENNIIEINKVSDLQLVSEELKYKKEYIKENALSKNFHNPEALIMLKESFSEIKIGINRKIKQMRQQKEKTTDEKNSITIIKF